jgi:hypothetical protein
MQDSRHLVRTCSTLDLRTLPAPFFPVGIAAGASMTSTLARRERAFFPGVPSAVGFAGSGATALAPQPMAQCNADETGALPCPRARRTSSNELASHALLFSPVDHVLARCAPISGRFPWTFGRVQRVHKQLVRAVWRPSSSYGRYQAGWCPAARRVDAARPSEGLVCRRGLGSGAWQLLEERSPSEIGHARALLQGAIWASFSFRASGKAKKQRTLQSSAVGQLARASYSPWSSAAPLLSTGSARARPRTTRA